MIRDGIKALAKHGVCSKQGWPCVVSKFNVKPGASRYREALEHQITSYFRISTVEEIRTCLAEGFPFVFGVTIYES